MTRDLARPHLMSDADGAFTVYFSTAGTGLSLVGELDCSSAPILLEAAALLRYRVDDAHLDLFISLSGLTFLDAAGLNAFLELSRAQKAIGCQLILTEVPDRCRRTFGYGQLDRLLTVPHPVARTSRSAEESRPAPHRRRAFSRRNKARIDEALRQMDHALRRIERGNPGS